jgi:hypothetical protein
MFQRFVRHTPSARNRFRKWQKCASGLSQANAIAHALEEGCAEFLLDQAVAPADIGLREIQLPSSACGSDEVTE